MVWRWGEKEMTVLSLYCDHQNDSCIKIGSVTRCILVHYDMKTQYHIYLKKRLTVIVPINHQ